MNKQSLDDFYDSLIEVLIHEIVFYVPKELISEKDVAEIKRMFGIDPFNELVVIDVYRGGRFKYEQGTYKPLLIAKHGSLEKNLFKLLQKKSEIAPFEFNYILDKYIEQVEFYHFITSWLFNHLALYIENKVNLEIQGDFQLQYNYYKKHLVDLIKHFYPSNDYNFREGYDPMEILEFYLPDFMARGGKEQRETKDKIVNDSTEIIEDENSTKTNQVKGIKGKVKKIKKEPLISAKASDDFILESVFNVKGISTD